MTDYFDWTDKAIANLRTHWAAGLSTKAIGIKLSCTKNAVVGKKNRLKLPSRPDPILRNGPVKPAKPVRARAGVATLGPLTIAHAGVVQPAKFVRFDDPDPKYPTRPIEHEAPIVDALPIIRERDEKIADTVPLPIFKPRISRNECQYPTTIAGRHRMLCDAPAINGPYCVEHKAICWVPTRAQTAALT